MRAVKKERNTENLEANPSNFTRYFIRVPVRLNRWYRITDREEMAKSSKYTRTLASLDRCACCE